MNKSILGIIFGILFLGICLAVLPIQTGNSLSNQSQLANYSVNFSPTSSLNDDFVVEHHSQPTKMSLQGRVTDVNGNLIDDGNLTVIVSDQNSCVSGIFYQITYNNAIQDGFFNILLGDTNVLSLNYNQDYFMCLKVNGDLLNGPSKFVGGHGEINVEDVADNFRFTDLNIDQNIRSATGNILSSTKFFFGMFGNDKNGLIFNVAGTDLHPFIRAIGSDQIQIGSVNDPDDFNVAGGDTHLGGDLTVDGNTDLSNSQLILPNVNNTPGMIEGGQIYYDTSDNTVYYLDSNVSKFLSLENYTFTGTIDQGIVVEVFFDVDGLTYSSGSAGKGFVLPVNSTLVLACNSSVSNGARTMKIYRENANVYNFTRAASENELCSRPNIDYSAGDRFSFSMDQGGTHLGYLVFKKRKV